MSLSVYLQKTRDVQGKEFAADAILFGLSKYHIGAIHFSYEGIRKTLLKQSFNETKEIALIKTI